jgi:hypothetical protein
VGGNEERVMFWDGLIPSLKCPRRAILKGFDLYSAAANLCWKMEKG